jgi:hypothetical protein
MIELLDRMYALVWRERDLDAWQLERTRADTVLALTTARGRASGVSVEQTFAQVWTFRAGAPIRMVLYADLEKGRAAARGGSAAGP